MQELFSYTKDLGILTRFLGLNTKVTIIAEDTTGKRVETMADVSKYAVASYCRRHINYQASTRYDVIHGIMDLDKEFAVYSVSDPSQIMGRVSLRFLLCNQVKTESGFPLFCVVHQGAPMGPVDVVVGNCEESEHTLLMINKNAAATCTSTSCQWLRWWKSSSRP
jgi:hypothetical protein